MKTVLKVIFGFLLLMMGHLAMAKVIHVDASNTGAEDGTSWGTAYTSLETAYNSSTLADGDEFWVAEGTYLITTPLQLSNSITIYGGFPSGGSVFSARDFGVNISTIDCGGGDFFGAISNDIEIVVDGATILNGRVDGYSEVVIDVNYRFKNTVINNLKFSFFEEDSKYVLEFENVNFSNYSGGYIEGVDSLILNNVVYENNTGGLVGEIKNIKITNNCLFRNNTGRSIFEQYLDVDQATFEFRDSKVENNNMTSSFYNIDINAQSVVIDNIESKDNKMGRTYFNVLDETDFFLVSNSTFKRDTVDLMFISFNDVIPTRILNCTFNDMQAGNIFEMYGWFELENILINNVEGALFDLYPLDDKLSKLKNFEVKNCMTRGGFIDPGGQGNIILENLTFENNSMSVSRPLIKFGLERLFLKDSKFINNSLTESLFSIEADFEIFLEGIEIVNSSSSSSDVELIKLDRAESVVLKDIDVINDPSFSNNSKVIFFEFADDSDVLLDNFNVQGYNTSEPLLCFVSGVPKKLKISNSSLTNNLSKTLLETSDKFVPASVELENVEIKNNTCSGTAFTLDCDTLRMENVVAEGNATNLFLEFPDANPGLVEIKDSKFLNNSSLEEFMIFSEVPKVEISTSTFEKNTSERLNDLISLLGVKDFRLDKSLFKDNNALFVLEVRDFFETDGTINIASTKFLENNSEHVFRERSGVYEVKIENSEFTAGSSELNYTAGLEVRSYLELDNISFKNFFISEGDNGAAVNADKGIDAKNCVFENNRNRDDDGGALSLGGVSYLDNCTFKNNFASISGAAFVGNMVDVKNCRFFNNESRFVASVFVSLGGMIENSVFEGNIGPGLLFIGSNGTTFDQKINNCSFLSNTSSNGGAIKYSGNQLFFENCLFDNNEFPNLASASGINAYSCTFVRNKGERILSAAGYGIQNSIVWNNQFTNPLASSSITHSNIQGGFAGEGNLNLNPEFVDPENGNFRLSCQSPLINQGSNEFSSLSTDLDGQERISASLVDMGAYEFQGDPSTVNVIPAPAFSVNSSVNCISDDLQLVNETPSKEAFTYVWEVKETEFRSTEIEPSFTFTESGDYDIKLTATNGCGFTAETEQTISISDAFVPTIFFPTSVCPGDTVEFSTDATCSSLVWSSLNGSILRESVNKDTVEIIFNDAGDGLNANVQLLATGCNVGGVCEKPVIVNVPIVPTQPQLEGMLELCENEQAWYKPVNRDIVPGTLYEWSVTNGTIVSSGRGYGLDSVLVEWQTAGAGQLRLRTYHEILDCEGGDTLGVTVRQKFAIDELNSLNKVCGESLTDFNVNFAGDFVWQVDGGTTAFNPLTGEAEWTNISNEYEVIATSNVVNAFCNSTDTLVINLIERPVLDTILGDTLAYAGINYPYEIVTTSPNVNSFSFLPSGGETRDLLENKAEIEWVIGTPNYSVSGTVRESLFSCESEPFVLEVKPDFEFEILGEDTVCVNTVESYTSNLLGLDGAVYKWVFADETVTGTINSPDFSFTEAEIQQIGLLIDYEGRSYAVTKDVLVQSLETDFNLTGESTISSEGGGTYVYNFENTDNLVLDIQVTGAVSQTQNANSLEIVWGTEEPYQISIQGSKTGEKCVTENEVLEILKAPEFVPEIALVDGQLCLNDSSTISFNEDEFTENVEWEVSNNASVRTGEDGVTKVFWPSNSGSFDVKVKFERFGNQEFTQLFTLNTLPTPEIKDVVVCGDREQSLETTVNYSNYQWFLEPDGTELGLANSITINDAGFYRVRVTDANGCEGQGGKYINQVEFPEPKIIEEIPAPFYCLDGTDQRVGLETLENPNFTYSWSAIGAVGGVNSSTFEFDLDKSVVGTSNVVSLTVSRPGCQETVQRQFVVANCVNVPCPDPELDFRVSDCSPFNFQQTEGRTDSPVNWIFGDNNRGSGNVVEHSYEEAGRYLITMTTGCKVIRKPLEVPVSAKFSFPENVCTGTEVEFENSVLSLPGTNIIGYSWDFGDGVVENGTGEVPNETLHTYSLSGEFPVLLIVEAEDSEGSRCNYIYTKTIKVNEAPQVSFNVGSPACESADYLFTNTSSQITSEAIYLWNIEGIEYTSKDANYTYLNFADPNKDVTLKVTDFIGCSAELTQTIQVQPPVEQQEIEVTGVTNLCVGASVELTSPVSENLSYDWYVNNQPANLSTESFVVTQPGTYKVEYKAPECLIFSKDIEITSFQPSTTVTQQGESCLGSDITLSLENLPSGVSVEWEKDNVFISKSANLSILEAVATNTGSYKAILTESKNPQCEFELPEYSLIINDLPDEPVLSLSKNGVCYDSSLTVTVGNYNPLNTYSYTVNENTLPLISSSIELAELKVDQNLSLSTIDENGCESGSEETLVKVNPDLEVNLTEVEELCRFESFDINSNLIPGLYTFQWFKTDGPVLDETSGSLSTLSADLDDSGDYFVVATTNSSAVVSGCEFTSDTVSVSILEGPEKPIIIGDNSFCEGDKISLITPLTDQGTISWSTGSTSDEIVVAQGDIYSLTIKNETTGCEAKSQLEVTENPLPNTGFIGTGLYEWCGNEELNFEALSDFSRYQWKLNGLNYGNENTQLFPRQSGNYTVEVESFDGCIDETDTLRMTSEPCGACEVITEADGIGIGSLRDALICANSSEGVDFIVFNIPGNGPFNLTIDSQLPEIEEGVIINGFSQTGNEELSINIGPGSYSDQLFTTSSSVTDLAINGIGVNGFSKAIELGIGASQTFITRNNFENVEQAVSSQKFGNDILISLNEFDSGFPLRLVSSSGIVIQNNEFSNTDSTIYVSDFSELQIENNSFSSISEQAILLESGSNLTITSNVATGTSKEVIQVSNIDDITIDKNLFGIDREGNVASISGSIKIDSSSFIKITENQILSSDQAVVVRTSNEVEVIDNFFGESSEGIIGPNNAYSLLVDSATYIKGNVFSGTAGNGLVLAGGDSSQIELNDFKNQTGNGILLLNGKSVQIRQNTFTSQNPNNLAINLLGTANNSKVNEGIANHTYGDKNVTLEGVGIDGDTIEVFLNDGDKEQALSYIGFAVVESSAWSFTVTEGVNYSTQDSSFYLMTATDVNGNTTQLNTDVYVVPPFICGPVTNVLSSGPGSFERAVTCANLNEDRSTITFELDAVLGAKEIKLNSNIDIIYPVDIIADSTEQITLLTEQNKFVVLQTGSESSRVEGLVVDGRDDINSRGILINSINPELQSVTFKNLGTALFIGPIESYDISDSYFESNSSIFSTSMGTVINESKISRSVFANNKSGISLIGGNGLDKKVEVSNSYFYGNETPVLFNVFSEGTEIRGNVFGEDREGTLRLNDGAIAVGAFGTGSVNNFMFQDNSVLSSTVAVGLKGENIVIDNNDFGFTADNQVNGIIGVVAGTGTTVRDNAFGGFDSTAIYVSNELGEIGNQIIENNTIGWDNSNNPLEGRNGILINQLTSEATRVINNTIGNLSSHGIWVESGEVGLEISENTIGISESNDLANNDGYGILLEGFQSSVLNNTVVNSNLGGIAVSGERNLISENIIFNQEEGITHQEPNGNSLHPKPVLDNVASGLSGHFVNGFATAGDSVEIFLSDGTQDYALEYLATVPTNGTGEWTYELTAILDTTYLLATAIDALNNTSEFSEIIRVVPYLCNSVITNTNDAGNGSLRRAIECANELGNDISVDIPGTSRNVINLASSLPSLNPLVSIRLDGLDEEQDSLVINGSFIHSGLTVSNASVEGMVLEGLNVAINLKDNSSFTNSIITSSSLALLANGNSFVVSSNKVYGNTEALVVQVASNGLISRNEIYNNQSVGILVNGSSNTTISTNDIGKTDELRRSNNGGVKLLNSSDIIISGNDLYDDQQDVILVDVGSQGNKISENEIFEGADNLAINLIDGIVNNSKDTASIVTYDNSPVSVVLTGEGQNGDVIEVFKSLGQEEVALEYIGKVEVVNNNWSFEILEGEFYKSAESNWYVTTATDLSNNTSELTKPFFVEPYICSFVVTNPDDKGNGTLRRAIECANASSDLNTITFDEIELGTSQITIVEELPEITEQVVIDGASTISFSSVLSEPFFTISASNSTVSNLTFQNLAVGVSSSGTANTFNENDFINMDQALVFDGVSGAIVSNSRFEDVGLALELKNSTDSDILNNEMTGLGQFIKFTNSSGHSVVNNDLRDALNELGLAVIENDNNSSRNLISQNLFNGLKSNLQLPIQNNTSGNTGLTAPKFLDASLEGSSVRVFGIAPANSKIELFFGDNVDLKNTVLYNQTIDVDGNGDWSVDFQLDSVAILLATATDANDNTSEFSDPFLLNQIVVFCPVTVVDDIGEGSFREAITCVNEAGEKGLQAIVNFELDENTDHVINVVNSGFNITNPFIVSIDPENVEVTLLSQGTEKALGWEVPNVTIKNLTFDGFDSVFVIKEAFNTVISNNEFDNFKGAITLSSGSVNTLESNVFNNGVEAVSLTSERNTRLLNNEFGEEGLINNAVVADSSHNFTFSGNVIYPNLEGIAFSLDTCSNGLISGNKFEVSETSSSIEINNSRNTTIVANEINKGERGILLTNSKRHLITSNQIDFVSVAGIELQSSDSVKITQNENDGLINAEPIVLNYGSPLASNKSFPAPEFTGATYKTKRIFLKGKAVPNSEVEIFKTNDGNLDLASYEAIVETDSKGFFEYSFPATLTDVNSFIFRATARENQFFYESDDQDYAITSEASVSFKPNLKVCTVTSSSDENVDGTLRFHMNKANDGECSLIIFDVPNTSMVDLSPGTDLPVINTDDLTIDGTCQSGYENGNPTVWLNNDNGLSEAFKIGALADENTIYIHGLGIRDYSSAIRINEVSSFENSLTVIENFRTSAIDFNVSEPSSILLDNNWYRSSASDYVLNIESPNVIVQDNVLEGGNIHNIRVNADSVLLIRNEINPFFERDDNGDLLGGPISPDSIFAVNIEERDSVEISQNTFTNYLLGVSSGKINNLLISSNIFTGPDNDSIIYAVHLSNTDSTSEVTSNTILRADSAIVIQNAFETKVNLNKISSSKVGIRSTSSDLLKLVANKIETTDVGIELVNSTQATIDLNTITGHDSVAVILDEDSHNNAVTRNSLGGINEATSPLSLGKGILVKSDDNTIGGNVTLANQIFFNSLGGIDVVKGERNKITFNQIYRNDITEETPTQFAIRLDSNGNTLKERPLIESYEEVSHTKYLVKGISEPNDSIHLYRSEGYYESARYYVSNTKANGSGEWEAMVDTDLIPELEKLDNQSLNVVATATDDEGNTSPLSDLHFVGTCFVNNTLDGIDNDYPIPNSFRQGMKCLNSLPVRDSLLVALDGSTGFTLGLQREMISVTNVHGGVIDGGNLISTMDPILIVNAPNEEAVDTTLFMKVSETVGYLEMSDMTFGNMNSVFDLDSKDSVSFDSLSFFSVEENMFDVTDEASLYSWDKIVVNSSPEATVFDLGSGGSKMAIQNSVISGVRDGVVSTGIDTLLVKNSSFLETFAPVTLSNSHTVSLEGNTFGIDSDTDEDTQPIIAINIDESSVINIETNTMAEVDTGLVVLITKSDSVVLSSNDFGEVTERGIQLVDVENALVKSNTFGKVDSILMLLTRTDTVWVVENKINRLGYAGIINEDSKNNFFSKNIISSVDTTDGKVVKLIDLFYGESIESNLGKPKPVIENWFLERGEDCNEEDEKLGIFISGSAMPKDSVEIFLSDTVSTTFSKFLGTVDTDENGYWEFKIPKEEYKVDLEHIFGFTATATDQLLFTSEEAELFVFDNVSNDIVVKNTNNTGENSLRLAIEDMNCSDLYNRVLFNIEAQGPHEIIVLDSTFSAIETLLGFEMDAGGTQQEFNALVGLPEEDATVTINGASLGDSSIFVINSGTDISKVFNFSFVDAHNGITVKNEDSKFENLVFTTTDVEIDSAIAIIDSSGGGHLFNNIKVAGYHKGFLMVDGSSGSTVMASEFNRTKVGVHLSDNTSGVNIENNLFYCDSVAVFLTDLESRNTISENQFGDEDTPITYPAVSLERSSSQQFTGNFIPYAFTGDLAVKHAVVEIQDESSNNQISGNRIGINEEGLSPQVSNFIGVRLNGITQDLLNNTVSKNDIAGLSESAIVLEGVLGGNVSSNYLGVDTAYFQKTNALSFAEVSGIVGSAITVANSEQVSIAGNEIINYTDFGIEVSNSENITIETNRILSEKTNNKGINLYYDDLTQVSNEGVQPPEIQRNGLVSEDRIWFEGVSTSPNATLQLFEAYAYEDEQPSQSLRFINSVVTNADGSWRIETASENFGFDGRNFFVAQVTEEFNSSEFSDSYAKESKLCDIKDNVDLLGDYFDPCPGSEFIIDAQLAGLTYSWKAAGDEFEEITTKMAQIDVSAEKVILTISDGSECEVIEEFEVEYKPEPVTPEFLVSSNISVSEVVQVIDISDDVAESLDWSSSDAITIVPSEGPTVIGSDGKEYPSGKVFQFLAPKDTTYTITQRSVRNGCFVSLEKEIVVTFKDPDAPKDPEFVPNLASLTVFPNPIKKDGSEINIVATNEDEIILSIKDLSGREVYREVLSGALQYSINFVPDTATETIYFVNLITATSSLNEKTLVD